MNERCRHGALGLVVLLGLIAGGLAVHSQSEAHPSDWLVLLYADGDNNLEGDMLDGFLELSSVGSSDRVRFVVQLDRVASDTERRFGDWTICHRFLVTQGMLPYPDSAIGDWGDGAGGREVDMADPETLVDFVNWATSRFPARRVALIVADHGFGWEGMCIDDTSGDSWMYLDELASALDHARTKPDLLGLDACIMATLEVAWELRSCGSEILVASEEWGTTWAFDSVAAALIDDPELAPIDLARAITRSYLSRHQTDSNVTLSAIRLEAIQTLGDCFSAFAHRAIAGASYESLEPLVQAAIDAFDDAVVVSEHSTERPDAHGLTIYFPDPVIVEHEPVQAPGSYGYYVAKRISLLEVSQWRDITTPYMMPLAQKPTYIDEVGDARRGMPVFGAKWYVDLREYFQRFLDLHPWADEDREGGVCAVEGSGNQESSTRHAGWALGPACEENGSMVMASKE